MSTMPLPRRRLLKLAAANLALTSLAAPALTRVARAQIYPSRPITMIVPYAAGGPTDTVGRVVAERMRAELGQPVVLENVAGAGGSIGLGRVARATPTATRSTSATGARTSSTARSTTCPMI